MVTRKNIGLFAMSFLVTGATGFIGTHVVSSALSMGHEVGVITRTFDKASQQFGDKVKIYTVDELFSGDIDASYEKVIHLAWADVSNYMDESNLRENLLLQTKFIDSLTALGISDITVAGTCLEYGMREGKCSEAEPAPEFYPTAYAKAKNELYSYIVDKKSPELNFKWLRFFYVYGVGSRPNSLLSLLLKAIENGDKEFNMSKGDQKRDFIHIETLAHNVVACAEQSDIKGIINIGNGKPVSVSEFVESILKIKKSNMKLNKGHYPYAEYEPHEFWADISKLKSVAKVKFDENIKL